MQDSDEATTEMVRVFVAQVAEVSFLMHVSDPPLGFDLNSIGQRVRYNQYKYESLDGFVKADQECLVVLPSVHKM